MRASADLIRRQHEHRAWVNENLLRAAAGLSDEQLRRPMAIGQGSIWKSLVHMFAAEFVWLAALEGDDNPCAPGDVRGKLPGNQLSSGGAATLEELKSQWSLLEMRWRNYLTALAPAALDELVYKVSSIAPGGQRWGTRRSDVLLHVALHAHYTAAQVVNMLRQCGVEKLPDTMLITLAREAAP